MTPFDIDARCRGEYRHAERSLENLTCLWPVGDGHLLLTGGFEDLRTRQAKLTLEINRAPASFARGFCALTDGRHH